LSGQGTDGDAPGRRKIAIGPGAVPDTNEWVTPVELSYVSSENASAQDGCGTGGRSVAIPLDNAIAARITVRKPEAPVEANGSVAEKICPLPTVKAAVPTMAPVEL